MNTSRYWTHREDPTVAVELVGEIHFGFDEYAVYRHIGIYDGPLLTMDLDQFSCEYRWA